MERAVDETTFDVVVVGAGMSILSTTMDLLKTLLT
jgi:ribulose 1,5-bisphosphate synthetase/thiazole synthase